MNQPAPGPAAAAALSALALLALGVAAERCIRADTERAVSSSRAMQERIEALTRNAEVLFGMGMLRHAVTKWRAAHHEANDTHERLSDATATFGALSRGLRQLVRSEASWALCNLIRFSAWPRAQ